MATPVRYNHGLGAEGFSAGRVASAIIDASTGADIDFASDFALVARDRTETPEVVDLVALLGDPTTLRYILIQPRGGDVEVLIGNQPEGVTVAAGERYAIPGISHDISFATGGPAEVYVEVAW